MDRRSRSRRPGAGRRSAGRGADRLQGGGPAIRSTAGRATDVRGRLRSHGREPPLGALSPEAIRRNDRNRRTRPRRGAAALLVRLRVLRKGPDRREAGNPPWLAVPGRRGIPQGDRGGPGRLGYEIRLRIDLAACRGTATTAEDAAASVDATLASAVADR